MFAALHEALVQAVGNECVFDGRVPGPNVVLLRSKAICDKVVILSPYPCLLVCFSLLSVLGHSNFLDWVNNTVWRM